MTTPNCSEIREIAFTEEQYSAFTDFLATFGLTEFNTSEVRIAPCPHAPSGVVGFFEVPAPKKEPANE